MSKFMVSKFEGFYNHVENQSKGQLETTALGIKINL